MFVDQVKISLKAGDGGNGITAYRREKYVPFGGLLVAMEVKVLQSFLKLMKV